MSIHFSKLQKKYKEVVKENADLRTQVAHNEAEKARVAHEYAEAAMAPLRTELAGLRDNLHNLHAQLAAASHATDETRTAKATVEDRLTDARAAISELVADRDAWKAKHEAQAPALAAAEQAVKDLEAAHAQQIADLKATYAQVERNATARERERIAAIENRKALANAVPARNRG